jgi:ABC-type nitrate/sulfonate/bicarbonate transport system substrate-binding protein
MSANLKVSPIHARLEAVKKIVVMGSRGKCDHVVGFEVVRALFCLILLLASSFFSTVQAEPIRLAYSSISGAMASLWVAQDYGYFRRQGLDVQLLYIGGGSLATQALVGGDVQFVRLGANSIVQASLRGANLKMIANTINTLVFSLMARPEIQTAKDLKGKKLA